MNNNDDESTLELQNPPFHGARFLTAYILVTVALSAAILGYHVFSLAR